MNLPFLGGNKPPEQTQQPVVFNNPSIGSSQPDPAKYQYHTKVESFEDDLASFKARLQGCAINFNEKGYMVMTKIKMADGKELKPFCNELGQHILYSFMDTRLKPTTPLSNIDVARFYKLQKDDHQKLFALVYINIFEWEVDINQWEELHFTMLDMVEGARRRSIDNEERNWIPKMLNIIQSISGDKKQNEGGSLKGLFSK